ncbi:universal stress protein [Desulfobacter vibrioformis]|uniref:universal stress protein n=1 Tax=Desulfobacter vibrioformis TaxID=34031 RepID=UPI000551665D|nr:universal stress protein [Desulfobacter vibrioformis]
MQIYKNILVTMDCSPVDDRILEHVAQLALQNRSKVFLLHVVHSHTLDEHRALTRNAEILLAQGCQKLVDQGIDAKVVQRSGEPDEQILKEIQDGDYDLVAMATHGHSTFGQILFGSVSKTLKQKISIPMLLLGPE